jgi:hypothetical protein
MKIAIEVNGVLRNTIEKLKQVYEKFLIESEEDSLGKTFEIGDDEEISEVEIIKEEFKYEIIEPITSLELDNFLKFKSNEEKLNFIYEEFPMHIFGHAPSSEMTTFNDFNEFYTEFREDHEIFIISDEIGKSKPSTLFFLSKFGCLVENVIFYNPKTIDKVITSFDLIVTSNPDLIINYSNSVQFVKYETEYNKQSECILKISTFKQLSDIIKNLKNVKVIQ